MTQTEGAPGTGLRPDMAGVECIHLRLFDLGAELTERTMILTIEESEALKMKALDKLGISRKVGETAYHAWLRTMCEENGLAFTLPVPTELANAIFNSPAARRFSWFMA